MSIRILLVEDDEHICNTVKIFLSEAGYQVDACMNGDEAYNRFYENIYQLVILDIMLPGMSGHELLREFRKLNNTPVLVVTALSDDENQIRAFDAEADDYVTKPFKIQLLVKRVEALLRRSTRGKELRDMTVGVLGTGGIGKAVINRLRGFGCQVLAYDRNQKIAADYVSLEALLHNSDIITLQSLN